MSTVAIEVRAEEVVMSGDRLASQSHWGCSTMTKVWKHDGQLIGLVGEAGRGIRCVQWYKDGADPETFPTSIMKGGDFLLLIWNGANIISIDEHGLAVIVDDMVAAVGSGAMAAMGAMRMGAGAQLAIEIASEIDNYTGRGTDTIRVQL